MKVISNNLKYASEGMYVLRDSRTNMALNVSYTPEGLYWATSSSGRLIYFKNARMTTVYDNDYNLIKVKIIGDTRPSDKVYIEPFVANNVANERIQTAEYAMAVKASRFNY